MPSNLQKDLSDLSVIRDRIPNFPIQEGKAACVTFTRDILAYLHETFDRHITYVSAETRVIGDYAFDLGTFSFTVTPKAGGKTEHPCGKYLWLYSRATDGSWKVARIIVSLDEDDDGEHDE
jgi:ketosteroid isomerase-like protein